MSDDRNPRRLGHVPGLDGLRGVAVLMVMVSHNGFLLPNLAADHPGIRRVLQGGFLGVDVFFVLSGFLITALLLAEERGTGSVAYRSFYARRALRLLPALYALLLAHALYAAIEGLYWRAEWVSILAAVTYSSNWLGVHDVLLIAPGTNHLWSLAVEEQFYLLWPGVLVGVLGMKRRASTVTVVLGVAILAVAVHRAVLWNHGVLWLYLFVRTDTRIDSLLVGALLASLWVRRATPTAGVDVAAWLAAGAVVVYAGVVDAESSTPYLWGNTAFAVAVAVVILAVVEGRWAGARHLAWRPLQAVGKVSYGLYLWHFPVFQFTARHGYAWSDAERVAVALIVTVGATLLSWFFVETLFQGYRGRFPPRAATATGSAIPDTA